MIDKLYLLDYRRRVHQHYAAVRESSQDREKTCRQWRARRDELFSAHPQSALSGEQRQAFTGLEYFDYDPDLRLTVEIEPLNKEADIVEIALEDDGLFRMQPFARVRFQLAGQSLSLQLFWILGYGGGLFLPFRDATAESGETYGGGRYLFDTIKGADLGLDESGRLLLDFNYAYNPSCAYSPRWSCPLSPPANRLDLPIRAGERSFNL